MYNIFIVNAHSANRGDEAAQRSMISKIKQYIPDANFVVLSEVPSHTSLQEYVKVLNRPYLNIRYINSIISFIWRLCQSIIQSYKADLVISAPGGPYFGELYASHEILHLYNIFIAKMFRKPVMIYGPSMGPFNNKYRNIIRKKILNTVEIITLRENTSYEYLKKLNLDKPKIYVTADSALQTDVFYTENLFIEKELENLGINNGEALVGFVPAGLEKNYPGLKKNIFFHENHVKLMAEIADTMVDVTGAKVLFMPQLYGTARDVPFFEEIIGCMKKSGYAKILPESNDSEFQQQIIKKLDFILSNRYHPIIFASKNKIPCVCISYEHKQKGFMKKINLVEYELSIKDIEINKMKSIIKDAWYNKEKIAQVLNENHSLIQEQALLNTKLVVALIEYQNRKNRLEDLPTFISSFLSDNK